MEIETQYKPEFCSIIIDLARECYTVPMIASYLGVSLQTLDRWTENNENFRIAMERVATEIQASFERKGLQGLDSKHFNSATYRMLLAASCPQHYGPKDKAQEQTGELSLLFKELQNNAQSTQQRIIDASRPEKNVVKQDD